MKRNIIHTLRAIAGMESMAEELPLESQIELAGDVAELRAEAETKELEKEIQEMGEQAIVEDELRKELEDCVDGMEFLKQHPNPQAMALLYNRADRIHVKLGGVSTKPRAGMESVDTRTLEAHVIVGCESFMDTLKKGADDTWKFLKALWERLVAYVVEKTNAAKRLSTRMDKLIKKLESDETEIKEEVIYGKWTAYMAMFSNGRTTPIQEISKRLVNSITPKDSAEGLVANAKHIHETLTSFTSKLSETTKTEKGKMVRVFSKEGLDLEYLSARPETVKEALEFYRTFRKHDFKVDYTAKEKSFRPTMPKSGYLSFAKHVKEIAEEVFEQEAIAKQGEREVAKTTKELDKDVRDLLRAQSRFTTAILTYVTSQRLKYAQASADYVAACIK
ncbi:phage protein [Vibrio phage pTD1]|uniref:Phage protein n=1 Tax=Vibrio phage pTD1 TaxID=1938577 RepID=A0A1Q2U2V9_9CAUD|nr:internal head protein [Vibrio phage pTD1]BAW98298.1 phage protein [Vibrio phage pTD1]